MAMKKTELKFTSPEQVGPARKLFMRYKTYQEIVAKGANSASTPFVALQKAKSGKYAMSQESLTILATKVVENGFDAELMSRMTEENSDPRQAVLAQFSRIFDLPTARAKTFEFLSTREGTDGKLFAAVRAYMKTEVQNRALEAFGSPHFHNLNSLVVLATAIAPRDALKALRLAQSPAVQEILAAKLPSLDECFAAIALPNISVSAREILISRMGAGRMPAQGNADLAHNGALETQVSQ